MTGERTMGPVYAASTSEAQRPITKLKKEADTLSLFSFFSQLY